VGKGADVSRRRRAFGSLNEPASVAPALAIVGKHWQNRGAFYVPRWVSCLSALMPDRTEDQWRAFFEWAQRTGFDGLRVFAGELVWPWRAPQSAELARARLPKFLDLATDHGFAVEVVVNTGTAERSYGISHHTHEVGAIVRGRRNVVAEGANEYDHASQFSEIEDMLARLMPEAFAGTLWTMGAPMSDEPDATDNYAGDYAGAHYNVAHLSRSRDLWNMVRRVRELNAAVDAEGQPCLNNEPMGADELDGSQTGKERLNDPAAFAALGALDRGFPGVGGVFHSQAGLHAELPGPVQQACADAYVAAHMAVDAILGGQPGDYRNTGHEGSPVGAYSDADWQSNIVRQYSFVAGDRASSVQIGVRPGVRVPWVDGWRDVGTRYEIEAADGRWLRVIEAVQ
jgi:hypothetical protein